MGKKPTAVAPPTTLSAATPHDIARNMRVVDDASGAVISAVISADAEAGKLSRFEVDDDGNLVREKDKFVVVEEDRKIRVEWIDPSKVDADVDTDDAGNG